MELETRVCETRVPTQNQVWETRFIVDSSDMHLKKKKKKRKRKRKKNHMELEFHFKKICLQVPLCLTTREKIYISKVLEFSKLEYLFFFFFKSTLD